MQYQKTALARLALSLTIALSTSLIITPTSHAGRRDNIVVDSSNASQFFDLHRKNKTWACHVASNGKIFPGFYKNGLWRNQTRKIKRRLKRLQKNDPARYEEIQEKQLRRLANLTKRCEQPCKVKRSSITLTAHENRNLGIRLYPDSICRNSLNYTTGTTKLGALYGSAPDLAYKPDHTLGQDYFEVSVHRPQGKAVKAKITINVASLRSELAGEANSLTPYRTNITEAEARLLLKRVAFGATDELVALSQTMTLDEFTDYLLNYPFELAYAAENIALAESESSKADHRIGVDLDGDSVNETVYHKKDIVWTTTAARRHWHSLMRNGDPVKEKMTHFLHDHFAIDLSSIAYVASNYNILTDHTDLLRSHALGRFDDLVSAMHSDYAMSVWLDNRFNTVSEPNENYGREFLELFTLGTADPITGIPNFNETDVKASTRALSGFITEFRPSTFIITELDPNHESNHPSAAPLRFLSTRVGAAVLNWSPTRWMEDPLSPEDITIFAGKPYEESSALDSAGLTNVVLYQHPGAPRYIGAKLFARLVHPNPNEAIVSTLASDLIANQYELKPCLLYTSDAADE